MFEVIDQISSYLPVYLLVFGRISAMVLTMPILGYATVHTRVRLIISMSITAIIAPMLFDKMSFNLLSSVDDGR